MAWREHRSGTAVFFLEDLEDNADSRGRHRFDESCDEGAVGRVHGEFDLGSVLYALITMTLSYHLVFKTRNTGLRPSTRSTVKRIVRKSFQNNAFSGVSQIFCVAMVFKGPGLWWTVVDTTLCQIYALSILATLMSRKPAEEGSSGSKGWSETSNRARAGPVASGVIVTVLEEHRLENADDWQATNVRFDNVNPIEDIEKGGRDRVDHL